MNKYTGLFAIIIINIIVILIFPVKGHADSSINVEQVKISSQHNHVDHQSLTTSEVILNGAVSETTFNYHMTETSSSTKNKIVLYIENSGLLISPSSLTIAIDGKNEKSIALQGKNTERKIEFSLRGEALKKGDHQVSIKFYGVLKEGVCVNNSTSANWLKVKSDSYIQLDTINSQTTLAQYPSNFIGTTFNPTTIVFPDKPTNAILNSVMQVASFLATQTDDKNSIQLVRESQFHSLKGNVIFIGIKHGFNSKEIREVETAAKLPTNSHALNLATTTLKNDGKEAKVLFVSANKPEDLQKRISILTNNKLINQLSGSNLSIEDLPQMTSTDQNNVISLAQFDMENLTLSSNNEVSDHYFYYLPNNADITKTINLKLRLKKSATIHDGDKNKETSHGNIELNVKVNGIPHSIDMRTLKGTNDGTYTVDIPISIPKEDYNGLLDIQFVANGLKIKDPCYSTDEEKWIMIHKNSTLTFSLNSTNNMSVATLASYPHNLIVGKEPLKIILPTSNNVSDDELFTLYHSLFSSNGQEKIELEFAKDMTSDKLQNSNVLFIGGEDEQPLLRKLKNRIISFENGQPDLQKYGFIREVTKRYAFIQKNDFGELNNQYNVFVIARTSQNTPYITSTFIKKLGNINKHATVATETLNNQFFTNSAYLDKNQDNDQVVSNEDGSRLSISSIVAFIGLIALIVMLLLLILKRKKRLKIKD